MYFDFGSIANKKFEFPTFYGKQPIQIVCSGQGLATFFANVTKVKIPSEIKQPLAELYVYNSSYHPMMQEGITYGNYMIERQYQLHNLTL